MSNKLIPKSIFFIFLFVAVLVFLFIFLGEKDTGSDFSLIKESHVFENQKDVVKYLEKDVINPSREDGVVFANYYEFGTEKEKIFLWAYIVEYYMENGIIKEGERASLPMTLFLSKSKKPIGHNYIQEEGDAHKIFPEKYEKELINFREDNRNIVLKLEKSITEKAENYFNEKQF